MSIKSKIRIPMIMIAVVAASFILFSNILQFSSFVAKDIEHDVERAAHEIMGEIETIKTKSHLAVLYYSNDSALISAMEHEDKGAVLKRVSELLAETDAGALTVVDTGAKVLARGHNPNLFGDDVSDIEVVRSALEGIPVFSVERGVSTSISIRSASPVYNGQGDVIGALFAGDRLDSDEFVDKIKHFTGCEITVFVDDTRVATTLLNVDGTRATGTEIPGYMSEALLAGDEVTGQVSLQNRNVIVKHTPIYNARGDIIAVISAEKFLTEKKNTMSLFVVTGSLITFLFLCISVLIIFILSKQIAAPISKEIDKAFSDVLTGIHNRRYLEENLSRILQLLSRSDGTLSFLLVDIDFFKKYNDTYGHIKGDSCLKKVASVLEQNISRAGDFVARYGGEEFAVVLPNTDEMGARLIADKMLQSIRKRGIPHRKSEAADHVTISIGVTTGKANHTRTAEDYIKQADKMLYESKQNGRNRYTFENL